MNISFPRMAPRYDSEAFALVFPAEVNGARIECGITAEALEDHFGALSIRETDLVDAFRAHRGSHADRSHARRAGPAAQWRVPRVWRMNDAYRKRIG